MNEQLNLRAAPFPHGVLFWIVTNEGDAVEVAFSGDHKLWTGREVYARQDGEPGSWEPSEIIGWTTDQHHAEQAAASVLLLQFGGAS